MFNTLHHFLNYIWKLSWWWSWWWRWRWWWWGEGGERVEGGEGRGVKFRCVYLCCKTIINYNIIIINNNYNNDNNNNNKIIIIIIVTIVVIMIVKQLILTRLSICILQIVVI